MSYYVITQPSPVMGEWVCMIPKLHTIPSSQLSLMWVHSLVTIPQMESFREHFVLSFRDNLVSFTESQLTHSHCLLAQLASPHSQLGPRLATPTLLH